MNKSTIIINSQERNIITRRRCQDERKQIGRVFQLGYKTVYSQSNFPSFSSKQIKVIKICTYICVTVNTYCFRSEVFDMLHSRDENSDHVDLPTFPQDTDDVKPDVVSVDSQAEYLQGECLRLTDSHVINNVYFSKWSALITYVRILNIMLFILKII